MTNVNRGKLRLHKDTLRTMKTRTGIRAGDSAPDRCVYNSNACGHPVATAYGCDSSVCGSGSHAGGHPVGGPAKQ